MTITASKSVIQQLSVILDDLSERSDRKDQWLHECIDRILDIQQQFLELEKLKFELMKQQYEDKKHKEVHKTMANYCRSHITNPFCENQLRLLACCQGQH